MNGHVAAILRWTAVIFAGLGLAYGYGALNNRVVHLELQSNGAQALIIGIAELTARMSSLEKEVERVRHTLERRSQTGASFSGDGRVP